MFKQLLCFSTPPPAQAPRWLDRGSWRRHSAFPAILEVHPDTSAVTTLHQNLLIKSQASSGAMNMMESTRRWLRRNRTGFAIGFGVIGISYVAGQYVLTKITEARERMAGDRIAKEKYITFR